MISYRERAERGAALLPPGWYKRIDTAQLDIGRCDKCICGQIYGSFAAGVHALQEKVASRDYNTVNWIREHGFNVATQSDFEGLTAAWRELIADLRLKDLAAERELVAA